MSTADRLAGELSAALARLLDVAPGAVDPKARLAELGVTSAMGLELLVHLSGVLGRALPATLLWEYPSVEQLASHLADTGSSDAGSVRVDKTRARTAGGVDEPIAIIGMACRFPGGAVSLEAYWRLLVEGREAIPTRPPEGPRAGWERDHAGSGVSWVGHFLADVGDFDARFFGISPREVEQLDPQQRLMLELSWEALEDARVRTSDLVGSDTGVFAGVCWNDYRVLGARGRAPTPHTGPGNALNNISNRVSYELGLHGPSVAIDTACSSALVAVHLACESLRRRESSLALAGAVNLLLAPDPWVAFERLGMLASDGRCRAFAAGAAGFGRGEGAGLVVLEPLGAALAAGRRIYGVIRGTAVNQDGRSNGLTAPNPKAQMALLRSACASAGVHPGQVSYVEAHGPGTLLGDPIEARALGEVYGGARPQADPLPIGSVKSNLGHLEAASGVAGLIKVALALHHRQLPPSLHCDTPNPHIDFVAERLRVQTAPSDWGHAGDPLVAGVSAFGWGGTNAHVIIEDAASHPGPTVRLRPRLRRAARGDRIAFVFTPQGGHWPGMARQLMHDESVFRDAIIRCDALLSPLLGHSIVDALATRTLDPSWTRPEVIQPLIFAMQVGLVRLWQSRGVTPDAVVGHCLGETTAAWLAGVLTLEDAALAIRHASYFQSRTADHTGIASLAMPVDEVRALIGDLNDVVIAAVNSPSHTNASGDAAALGVLVARARAQGAAASLIDVDVATHSPHIDPVMAPLRQALAGIAPRRAELALVSTVTGEPLGDADVMDGAWVAEQYRRPVLFRQAIEHLLDRGIQWFVEIGPHPVLSSALNATVKASGRVARVLSSLRRGESAGRSMDEGVDALRTAGVLVPLEATRRAQLLALSAHTEAGLGARSAALAEHLRTTSAPLRDVCFTTNAVRDHHRYRKASLAHSSAELAELLSRDAGDALGSSVARDVATVRGRTAFVFPGHGSEWAAMGQALHASEPAFAEALEACDRALAPHIEWSILAHVIGSPDDLRPGHRVDVVQPALFAMGVSLAALWRAWGVEPDVVIGHSHGEVTAAVVAGALSLEDGALLIAHRSRILRDLAPPGGVAVVELSAPEVRSRLARRDGLVGIAALNGPRTTVVSGPVDPLDTWLTELGAEGIFARRVAMDYASHSADMDPLCGEMRSAAASISPQVRTLEMLSTVDPGEVPLLDGAYWADNLRQPVRLLPAVRRALDRGVRVFVEISPHPLLGPALRATLDEAGVDGVVVTSLRRGRGDRAELLRALGELYERGFDVNWRRFHGDDCRAVDLPTYPFQRQTYWLPDAPRPSSRRPGDPFDVHIESSTEPGTHYFETHLAVERTDGDTQVAAMVLDLVAHALDAASLHPATLGDICFEAPISPCGGTSRHVQLVVRPDAWRLATRAEGGPWQIHVRGALEPRPLPPSAVGPQARVLDTTKSYSAEVPVAGVERRTLLDACLTLVVTSAGAPGRFVIERIGALELHGRAREAVRIAAFPEHEGRSWAVIALAVDASVVLELRDIQLAPVSGVLWRERWDLAPSAALAPAVADDRSWLVVGGPAALAQRLCVALGPAAEHVRSADASSCAGRRVILLHGLTPPPGDQLLDALVSACDQLVIARTASRLVVVTRRAVPVGDVDTGAELGSAALIGLLRVVRTEVPGLGARVIDMDDPEQNPASTAALIAELHAASPPERVAIREGHRYLPTRALWYGGPGVQERWSGVVVVTGGLGALGLQVARRVVARGATDVVLLGRRPPGSDAVAVIDELRARGARVEALSVDVTDRAALGRIFATLRDSGRELGSVVHAAGVLDDALVSDITPANLRRVLAPKVVGAWNLHVLTKDRALDHFVLFSSLGGWLGMAGQGAYAAANAFLDGLAAWRQARGLPGVSIGWCGWKGLGFASSSGGVAVTEYLESQGLAGMLDVEPALDLLSEVVRAPSPPPRLAVIPPTRAPKPPDPQAARTLPELERIQAAPTAGRRLALLAAHVRAVLAAVLRLPVEAIEPGRPMQEQGLDSLMAVELTVTLGADLGVRLPKMVVWQHPTPLALAEMLGEQLGLSETLEASAPPADGAALSALLDELDGLSEEEAVALALEL